MEQRKKKRKNEFVSDIVLSLADEYLIQFQNYFTYLIGFYLKQIIESSSVHIQNEKKNKKKTTIEMKKEKEIWCRHWFELNSNQKSLLVAGLADLLSIRKSLANILYIYLFILTILFWFSSSILINFFFSLAVFLIEMVPLSLRLVELLAGEDVYKCFVKFN